MDPYQLVISLLLLGFVVSVDRRFQQSCESIEKALMRLELLELETMKEIEMLKIQAEELDRAHEAAMKLQDHIRSAHDHVQAQKEA